METKSKSRVWVIVLILAAVAFLALILLLGYRYMAFRLEANISPPQVLIHQPYNQESLYERVGTTVHATARSEDGVSRIELWVDGEFQFAVDAKNGEAISPLVLHKSWAPIGVGTHEIIIRAIDSKGVAGVGSIIVTAAEAPEDVPAGIDPLAEEPSEGGDVPVIDEPGDPGDEPAPGGDEPAPSGSGEEPEPSGGGGEPAPGSGGDEPGPGGGDEPAPGSSDDPPPSAFPSGDITILQFLFGFFSLDDPADDEPTGEDGYTILYLEGLGLETDAAYEGVHCYVGLGDSTPAWYPDTDLNQSTDESFLMIGDLMWNIADHMSEDNALVTAWPTSEPVTAKVNCVAISGGGTEAINLGVADITAPPEDWDGVTRNVEASEDGWFRFAYRIGQEPPAAKELDPTIPVPFNVRIDERRQELMWDWENTPDNAGAGVTGFMIYVNDTLVFTAHQDGNATRAARIPYSWFTPPCRTEYEFTVRAYKHPYPDGDFSEASEPAILPDPDDPVRTDCQPEFIVDFHTLRTGNIPGDGRPNNWAGYVGPVSGSFYANGDGRIFQGFDLLPNQTYDLHEMIWDSSGQQSHFTIEPTPGEYILVGFDLAKYLGWDGFDTICESYFDEYSYSELMSYGYFEGTLYSVRTDEAGHSLCQADYTISHQGGSPLGLGEDWMPLPWLDITGMLLEPGTNQIILEITNNGSAMWANHTLRLDLDGRERTIHSSYTETDFVLDVGETKVIRTETTATNIWEYCIKIDENNEVLELYENTGALQHSSMSYCMPRPDLRLHDVQYDFDSNTLKMRVWNVGSHRNSLGTSDVNLADLVVGIDVPGSTNDFNSPDGLFAGEILERENGIWLDWTLTPEQRALMNDGYTVQLDPMDTITETDEDNNDFEVPGGENIRLVWNGVYMRWYPDSILHECPNYGRWAGHDYDVWVDVFVRSEYSNQRIVSWHYEGETHGDTTQFIPIYGWDADRYTTDLYVHGEESIVVDVRGEQERESLGSTTGYYEPDMNWRIMGNRLSSAGRCVTDDPLDGGDYIQISPSNRSWGLMCGSWYVYINRCTFNP